MRKLLCLLLTVSLLLPTGCIFNTENDEAEAVNKGMSTGETVKDDSSSKGTAVGSAGESSEASHKQTGSTPVPEKDASDKPDSEQKAFAQQNNSADSSGSDNQKDKDLVIFLYYQDAQGSIVPLSRKVTGQNGIARAAVNGLIDEAINREEIEYYGVYPVLPQGTVIKGINVVDGIATIDFNSKVLNYKTGIAERNIVSSVVYTMTQFETIKGVKIWVEGKTQKLLKFNTDISGILSRKNVMINSEKLNLGTEAAKSDIYLIKDINEKLQYAIPVSVEHSKIEEDVLPEKLVELLSMDYTSKKLYSSIPADTRLISCDVKDGLATLNFNAKIRNYGGNAREEALIKQVMYTVGQIKGIKRLKILIEGKEAILPEGTELTDEIRLPEEINALIEM